MNETKKRMKRIASYSFREAGRWHPGGAPQSCFPARTRRFPALKVQVLESYLLTSVDFTFERGAFGTFPGIGPVPAEDTKISTPRRPST